MGDTLPESRRGVNPPLGLARPDSGCGRWRKKRACAARRPSVWPRASAQAGAGRRSPTVVVRRTMRTSFMKSNPVALCMRQRLSHITSSLTRQWCV